MKNISIRLAAALFALLLLLSGCTAAPAEAEASPSPTAAPTASPTPEPTAEPTAAPTEESTSAPSAETEITVEIEAMYPLLKAHALAQLNGGSFDADDPEYFWQTVTFAIDGCGMDFYTGETVGSALVLSRGVIEEIASGLFENGGEVLLEIPDSLSGEIQYDTEADAFAHPLNEGGFTVSPVSLTENEDGSLTLTAQLFAADDPETEIVSFTAVLVPNTRSGNSLFTLSVRGFTLEA